MAIVSCGSLIDELRRLHLLDETKLKALFAEAGGRFADVRRVAKLLIQRGWFSVYQMNQLLAGHGKDLILGPYLIIDRLGKGGQSEVYKAKHTQHAWIVALKVVRSAQLATSAATQQYLQEMTAMSELDHPNIVQFLDVDKVDGVYYCAMEFVEGNDLGKLVQLEGRLSPAEAAEYARQTALGLQHAHEHNIIHRDVKPVNLYLTLKEDRQCTATNLVDRHLVGSRVPLIKILDWGIASIQQPGSGCKLPASSTTPVETLDGHKIVGTPDYMSPEQALNPASVDIRADIYSLGCSLYYLLSGQPPFGGKTLLQKVMEHQTEAARPLPEVIPEISRGLDSVVQRMIAKKREDRFQTPVAAALALAPFCRLGAASDSMDTRGLPPHPSLDRRRPRDETPSLSSTLLGR
jgi:eukaryotic-like serine/threonine-protein kinase